MSANRRFVALLAALTVGTVVAGAGSAIAAPPAPTAVTLTDANDPANGQPDGWVNKSEEGSVFVRGSFDTTAGITEIEAVVSTAESVDPEEGPAGCDADAANATPPLTIPADATGAFSIGPFSVASFEEGRALCAIARAKDATSTSPDALSANYKTKDTVAPPAPTIESPASGSKVPAETTFAGAAAAGSTVSLIDPDEAAAPIGAAPVNATTGKYSLKVTFTKTGSHAAHTVAKPESTDPVTV